CVKRKGYCDDGNERAALCPAHPQYRQRYAENLKRELPRIPLLSECSKFETCVRIGKRLMELHLNYEQAQEYPLKWVENRDVLVNWRVEKMRLTPNKEAI